MTGEAFTHGLPGQWGHWIVTVGLVLFAYSTILGWAYYGERNVERLVGRGGVTRVIQTELDATEMRALHASADALRREARSLGF